MNYIINEARADPVAETLNTSDPALQTQTLSQASARPWYASRLAQWAVVVAWLIGFIVIDKPWGDLAYRGVLKPILIALVYLAMSLTILAGYLSRRGWLRWLTSLVLAITLMWHFGYLYITREVFSYDGALVVLSGMETADSAAAMYWRIFLPLLAIPVALILVSHLLSRHVMRFKARWTLAIVPLLVAMAGMIWYTSGRINAFPTPMRVLGAFGYQMAHQYHGPREEPKLTPRGKGMPHVIFIVDESVKASHLTINGYDRPTTPLLAKRNDLLTLGIAAASGNSSYTSQSVLFGGMTLADLPDDDFRALKKPSLAQYAHKAGYRFGFFDGQDYRRLIWTAKQVCTEDGFMYVSARRQSGKPGTLHDRFLLEKLVSWVESNDKTVSYVAKWGAHYPYEDIYPQDRKPFTPTLDGLAWSDDEAANRNSYDNAMSWVCDDFLNNLFDQLGKLHKDIVVIYTSDHGQSLPGSLPGWRQTHCNPDLPSDSAEVPIIIWGSGSGVDVVKRIKANASLVDHASHFDLFPTLLELIGYDRAEIAPLYGQGLFVPVPADRERRYLGGMIENTARSKIVVFKMQEVRRDSGLAQSQSAK